MNCPWTHANEISETTESLVFYFTINDTTASKVQAWISINQQKYKQSRGVKKFENRELLIASLKNLIQIFKLTFNL